MNRDTEEKNTYCFLIIDGNALLHRAWHAIPLLTTEKGEVVNAAYGFTMILMKALKDLKPTHVALTFDRRAPTFRHEAYKEYKAKRVKQPDELYQQIDRIREIASAFGIPIFEKDGFEADDIIATLCKDVQKNDPSAEKIILTGDMDALQLVNETTRVYAFRKGLTDFTVYDQKAVREKYNGLTPEQLTDYKALRGDPSDNIPGVKGIGEKTAIELIKRFGSLEQMYKKLNDQKEREDIKNSVLLKLDTSEKEAYESFKLVALMYDVPIDFSFQKSAFCRVDTEKLLTLFQELGFKSLIPRLKEWGIHEKDIKKESILPIQQCHVVTSKKDEKELSQVLEQTRSVSIFLHEGTKDLFNSGIEGIVFDCEKAGMWYLPWKKIREAKDIMSCLEDEHIQKQCHDSKMMKHVLSQEGIQLRGVSYDTLLTAYILNSGAREYTLESLALSELGISLSPPPSSIDDACKKTGTIRALAEKYTHELQGLQQEFLLQKIELPLVDVLLDMETNGVKVDTDFLEKISKKLNADILGLEEVIYGLAGERFNIASPLQVKKILFEKLELSTSRIRKGKTGLSTAASELEKMRHLHPIIEHIFQFRELAKLKNTYVDVLPKLVDTKTGRIHTQFNQTVTSTGRLSSSNPNLQNIPIKTSLGKEIRKAFIAEEGHVLVAVDYSQVELRIIASLAEDAKMIHAFSQGIDIHTATAAEIHNVLIPEVTPAMRRAAKEINFGIIYGMGAQGLSESAKISFAQAKDFIDRYFLAYPAVRKYMDETIKKAKNDGYISTYFGRRRYLPELQSHIFQLRSAAERMAINMPVQGTAADIMKLAMISVHNRLSERYTSDTIKPVRMILQVHDELVFEVRSGYEQELAHLVKKEMESVVQLAVPLLVDVRSGLNWGDMKKYEAY